MAHAEFERVNPGLFEAGLAVTSVTTMAARVGFGKSLLHILSLEKALPNWKNLSSVVADEKCHKSGEASG